jgi:ADP-ribose pyrophosphatase YjhB (NUDIX family)
MPATSTRGSRKFVYAVMLDPPTRRVLLTRSGAAADECWTVPKVPVRSGLTYRSATVRSMCRRRKLQPVRIAPVVGRLFAIDDAEKLGYVVLVLPETGRWKDKPGRMLGPAARWWTISALSAERVRVMPPQLLDLVEGYWEGWLPDGEVSLV